MSERACGEEIRTPGALFDSAGEKRQKKPYFNIQKDDRGKTTIHRNPLPLHYRIALNTTLQALKASGKISWTGVNGGLRGGTPPQGGAQQDTHKREKGCCHTVYFAWFGKPEKRGRHPPIPLPVCVTGCITTLDLQQHTTTRQL